jgi:hypothetical protein
MYIVLFLFLLFSLVCAFLFFSSSLTFLSRILCGPQHTAGSGLGNSLLAYLAKPLLVLGVPLGYTYGSISEKVCVLSFRTINTVVE